MKKLVTLMLASCIAVAAFAQPQEGGHKRHGDKPDFEKIKAEQVAFITGQVGLTPAEAEAFWPVYNKIDAEQRELQKAEREAYKALHKALKSGEGNVDALLGDYLKAKEANINLHVKHSKDYKKVLSTEKVARFYTCEESFRRQQIDRLRGGHDPKDGPEGPRDGKKGRKDAPGEANGR